LLRDGKVAAQLSAGSNGRFSASITGLSPGTYTFGIWGLDKDNVRSLTYTFTQTLTQNVITTISGIFLPPTLRVDKSIVKYGEPLAIFGATVPGSEVTVTVNSQTKLVRKLTADTQGLWRQSIDTTALEYGEHSAQSWSKLGEENSGLSSLVSFRVGDTTVLADATPLKAPTDIKGDVNADARVNLVDFSIVAYWFKRPLTPGAAAVADLNSDGKVDLIDFSIMAYYWTG
jgi:hypothetical protein